MNGKVEDSLMHAVCAWALFKAKTLASSGCKIRKVRRALPPEASGGGLYLARAARRKILRGCLKPPVPLGNDGFRLHNF